MKYATTYDSEAPGMSGINAGGTNRRRRVLHFIDTSMADSYLLSFAEHGAPERFEYIFGTLAAPGALHSAAHELGAGSFGMSLSSRWSYPRAMIRLARYLAGRGIDLVHTHLFDPSVVGLMATRLAGVPQSVFTAHHVSEWEVAGLGSRQAAALDRLIRINLADHVVAPSDYISRVLIDSDGRTEADMTVIPHGIDVDRFAAARQHRASVRRELHLGDATVLGAIGRLSAVKNYPMLIRAFARLAGADQSLVLLVVGQGNPDGLTSLARTLGIAERVRILGWRRDVCRILSAFDVLVHPALAETFGFAVVEALAAGIPVVSTSVGIASTVIETGSTGVLLGGPNESDIVVGLQEMLRLRAGWPEMARAGQERARCYSAARMVAGYEELYERLLESPR